MLKIDLQRMSTQQLLYVNLPRLGIGHHQNIVPSEPQTDVDFNDPTKSAENYKFKLPGQPMWTFGNWFRDLEFQKALKEFKDACNDEVDLGGPQAIRDISAIERPKVPDREKPQPVKTGKAGRRQKTSTKKRALRRAAAREAEYEREAAEGCAAAPEM